MRYFRRTVSLERDIRHAYVQMKTLVQTEEKVKNIQENLSRLFLEFFLDT
jgi:hypothetical protein